MKQSLIHTGFGILGCLFTLAGPASVLGQSLRLQSGFVDWTPEAPSVQFSLTFNRAPDFFTTDQAGRQADSFQFFIGPDPSPLGPYLSIIRGEEIHVAGDIRIRNQAP